MDNYKYLLISILKLISLYLFVANTYASFPTDPVRIAILFITLIFIAFEGFKANRYKLYFRACIIWSTVLLPLAFYILMFFTMPSLNLDNDTLVHNFGPILVAYNISRYVLGLCTFSLFVKDFFVSFNELH